MINKQDLIQQLKDLLKRKKSYEYYGKKLGVTKEEVQELMLQIKQGCNFLEELSIKFQEDVKAGKADTEFRSPEEIRTLDELIEKGKIDTSIWNIDNYVQNYWGNIEQPHWQVKAFLSKKTDANLFQDNFIKF